MPILEQEGRKGTLKPSLGIKVFIGFSSCGLFARSISGPLEARCWLGHQQPHWGRRGEEITAEAYPRLGDETSGSAFTRPCKVPRSSSSERAGTPKRLSLPRLASSVFVDYGESFTCRDKAGLGMTFWQLCKGTCQAQRPKVEATLGREKPLSRAPLKYYRRRNKC